MALINTLRNKGGAIIIGLIGFSVLAFIGADLLGPNSRIFGGNDTIVGEIAGEKIDYRKEFLVKQEEVTFNFQQGNRRNPSSSEQEYIRNQTWEALIAEYAFKNQFDEVGLQMTDEELIDMVQGDNINDQIKQAFTNPETGEFSKENVTSYLSNIKTMPAAQQASWFNFEKDLGPNRLRAKYNNLIVKTSYASQPEAKFEFMLDNESATVNYMYVPYFAIKDTAVTFTEKELKAYLSSHEKEYQKEESIEIKYVAFNVVPSAEDSANVKQDILALKKDFVANTASDSAFAASRSESKEPYKNYTVEALPQGLLSDGNVIMNEVVGPFVEDGSYVLYKVTSTDIGTEYAARASHILFKWENESVESKAAAKKEARDVLKQIRGGASFAEMAMKYGTDGTKTKGGDLGWFTQGKQMVKEFDDAVFAASKSGLLSDVVETQFGYHIIEVTAAKTNLTYNVAKVGVEFFVSDDTRNLHYRKAENFVLEAKDLKSLIANAEKEGLKVTEAKNINNNTSRITGLAQARVIVSWAFNKASVGDVSEVYEIEDQYVIAALSTKQEKGVADLETVRNEIEKKVRDAKKAELIIAKMKGMTQEELVKMTIAYEGGAAKYYSMTDLKLSSNSLNSVGLAPEAVGVIFSMENDEKTAPFALDNGVILIELVKKEKAPEMTEYDAYKSQVVQKRQARLASKVDNAVRELADIKDNRYKFF